MFELVAIKNVQYASKSTTSHAVKQISEDAYHSWVGGDKVECDLREPARLVPEDET